MLQEFIHKDWTSRVFLPDNRSTLLDEGCDLKLDAVGKLFSNGKFVYEQVSSVIAVHVIEHGSGEFTVNNRCYAAGPGDIFTFFPGQHYRYRDFARSPWKYDWFRVSGERSRAILAAIGIAEDAPLLKGDFSDPLGPLLATIGEAYAQTDQPLLYDQCAAWRIIAAISAATAGSTTSSTTKSVADAAKCLMDDDFASGLTIDEVARRIGVARSTLFRQFRDRYRVSPKEYLDTVRLDKAKRLLRQSAAPVHDIAALCGFEDSHYFSRAYRKATGHSPSDERH